MPGKWPWFERKFTFDCPPEKLPDLIERLRGTPVRVEALVKDLPAELLTRKLDDTWSIQENVGHLADVEALWLGRLDDFLNGCAELRPAEIAAGKVALRASHNERPLREVIDSFSAVRRQFVARLEAIGITDAARSALHPRLQQPMRIIDLCIFAADHDDYHLARISELKRLLAA